MIDIKDELENMAHILNDVKTVQDVIKNLVEKANEIDSRLEPRIKMLSERLDRLTAEQPKKDHHKPAPGGW